MIWMGDPQTRMLSSASMGSTTRLTCRQPMPQNFGLHWRGSSTRRVRHPAEAGRSVQRHRPLAAAMIQRKSGNGHAITATPLTAAAEFRLKSRRPTKRQIPRTAFSSTGDPATAARRGGVFQFPELLLRAASAHTLIGPIRAAPRMGHGLALFEDLWRRPGAGHCRLPRLAGSTSPARSGARQVGAGAIPARSRFPLWRTRSTTQDRPRSIKVRRS